MPQQRLIIFSASVSLHTFSFMALYKFLFNLTLSSFGEMYCSSSEVNYTRIHCTGYNYHQY